MALGEREHKLLSDKLGRMGRGWHPVAGTLQNAVANAVKANAPSINANVAVTFLTCSAEMWHRAIHAFLLSVATRESSPSWSSISGYYSSHFVARAFAHLFGYYGVHKRGGWELTYGGGAFILSRYKKTFREHDFYREVVDDELARWPVPSSVADQSHRSFANYADHIGRLDKILSISGAEIKKAVERIALVNADEPDKGSFPDLDSVQARAHERLCYYRSYCDNNAGLAGVFWKGWRDPDWCKDMMIYRRPETETEAIRESQLEAL